jgi:malonate-semialdehyde dehydrogenase (acetylating)/methylmalonate-semialdehyde dehydrogenase
VSVQRITHVVRGKRLETPSERSGPVFDPATGEITGEVAFATAEIVDHAVAAAREAFYEWRATPLGRRAHVLFAFRRLVAEHAEDLARTVSAENGKTLADARGEVARGLEVVEFACGLPQLLKGEYSDAVSSGVDTYSLRQPLGVVSGITPFNFPAMVPLWMCPVAIACGNAVVLKPSEKDPSAAVALAELWDEAGVPPGTFNVIHGDQQAVEALLDHPGVDAVSFVGSTPVARHVYARAAAMGKRVQALGGAKNHMVVCPDADLDAAADAAVSAAFGSAGERCMAVSVLVAVDPVGDELVERVTQRAREVRVGPGDDPDTDMGPLVTAAHRDRVAGFLDAGVADGAVLVVDGRRHPHRGSSAGFYLGPSVLDRVRPGMRVYEEEIFGPVLCVVRVASLEEALALVNANRYGNGAAVFTRDGGLARRFQREVEAGMVGINVPIPVPVAWHSFGGWKQSLFGDARVYGPEGVHFYTRQKVVTARWPDGRRTGLELSFPAGTGAAGAGEARRS